MSAPGVYDIDIEADDIDVTDTVTVIKSYRQGMATASCFSEYGFVYIIGLWR